MKLSPKHRIFVAQYVKTRKIAKSAIAAGYSKKTARAAGSRLLRDVNIRASIDASLNKITERAEISAAEVLRELALLATVRIKDAYNEDGTLKSVHEMPEQIQAALASLEVDEIFAGPRGLKRKVGETKKLKVFDKVRSLELLGKHFKLFTDVTELTGKDGGVVNVNLTMPPNGSEAADE